MQKGTVILFLLVASLTGCQEEKGQNKIDVSVSEFEKRITKENAYLLDVRTPDEVLEGVIEGAVVLNILGPEFKKQFRALPKNKIVYVYCKSGNRSRKAVIFLKEQGYDSVYHLDGGMDAWRNANKKIKQK